MDGLFAMAESSSAFGTLMPGAEAIHPIKLNDVDPQTHFADVLAKLVNLWPAARIDELMPWAWGAANRIAAPAQAAA
jgi:IS66 C-terminal element